MRLVIVAGLLLRAYGAINSPKLTAQATAIRMPLNLGKANLALKPTGNSSNKKALNNPAANPKNGIWIAHRMKLINVLELKKSRIPR